MGQQTASKAGGTLSAMGLGAGNPMAEMNKAKAFWGSAYMPTTAPGLFAAAEQALMMVKKPTMGDMVGTQLNPIMLSRVSNCLDMLEIKSPGDPRLAGLQKLYEKKKKETGGLKKVGICFPADTRFLTPKGRLPVSELERGDEVLSVGSDGQITTERVTKKISYGLCEILHLQLGDRVLKTTAHHSIQTGSGWKKAGQLVPGDRVLCVNEQGQAVTSELLAVETSPAEPVFNLHTTGPHTALAEGVLTHNFNKLRWIRVLWHKLAVDPWLEVEGSAKGAEI